MTAETASRETRIEVAGGTFDAWEAGERRPPTRRTVLFLHGFPQTRHTWREQLPALEANGHRAVAPNQRGLSPGARPNAVAEYATDVLVGDVVSFIDWCCEGIGADGDAGAAGDVGDVGDDRRVDLVGHDWGGQLAWLTAAQHPDRVRSLTVLSRPHPAAFARSFAADEQQAERSKHHRAFDDPATADLLLEEDARRLRRMLTHASVPAPDVDAYLEVLGERAALEAALNWYRATSASGLRAIDTPVIEVPTLYIWGTEDQSVGRAAAELTEMYVAGSYHFIELEGGGHFLTDDGNSAAVTEALLGHIAAT